MHVSSKGLIEAVIRGILAVGLCVYAGFVFINIPGVIPQLSPTLSHAIDGEITFLVLAVMLFNSLSPLFLDRLTVSAKDDLRHPGQHPTEVKDHIRSVLTVWMWFPFISFGVVAWRWFSETPAIERFGDDLVAVALVTVLLFLPAIVNGTVAILIRLTLIKNTPMPIPVLGYVALVLLAMKLTLFALGDSSVSHLFLVFDIPAEFTPAAAAYLVAAFTIPAYIAAITMLPMMPDEPAK